MTAKVSVVNCPEYDVKLVYDSIKKALKDINFEIKEGSNILLKPNILNQSKPESAVVTHYTVVDAMCKILKEKNCKISIGESSGNPLGVGGTKKAFETSKIKDVANKYDAKIVAFEAEKLITESINGKVLKKITFAKCIRDFDRIINLPKLKTHMYTNYTGAIKNTYGFVPGALKIKYHQIGSNIQIFGNILLDIYSKLTPHLNIMDAIIGMEGNGPNAGEPKQTGYILASSNGIALDLIAQKMIGLPEGDQVITNLAKKRGIFNDKIEVIGKLPLIKYKTSSDKIRKLPSFLRVFIDSQGEYKPFVDVSKCIKCGACAEVCPREAIKLKPYPVIDHKKCIRCYCCHELCQRKAINLKQKAILRLARKIPSLKKAFGLN